MNVELTLTDGTTGSVNVYFRDPETEPVEIQEAAVGVMSGALMLGEVIGQDATTGRASIRLRIIPLDTITEAVVIQEAGL